MGDLFETGGCRIGVVVGAVPDRGGGGGNGILFPIEPPRNIGFVIVLAVTAAIINASQWNEAYVLYVSKIRKGRRQAPSFAH
jgi:hypothetical protein|mmetsp:Transcript_56296/g.89394  ORF Transcript_56296/g.89394 Transcript_56296/m.89394 type:complete len:82 (+) Transcript_56296:999-1244(+)